MNRNKNSKTLLIVLLSVTGVVIASIIALVLIWVIPNNSGKGDSSSESSGSSSPTSGEVSSETSGGESSHTSGSSSGGSTTEPSESSSQTSSSEDPVTPTYYTIHFDLNGGNSESIVPASKEVTDFSKNDFFYDCTKNGYTFVGWSYNNEKVLDQLGTVIKVPTMVDNMTFKAMYTPNEYTITYNLGGGTNNPGNPSTYTPDDETIVLLTPTKDYYSFDGWYDSIGYTHQVTSIPHGNYGNVELFAKWSLDEYTITYHLYDGTNNPGNPNTYTHETSTITLLDPSKPYCTFEGWFDSSGYTHQITEIPENSSGNVDLYAKWSATTFNITYNLDGGTNNPSNPSTYTYDSETINFLNPTKDHYTFMGWYDSIGYTQEVTSIPHHSHGDVELFAKWELTNYTITYNLDGGTNNPSNPSSYTYESVTINLLDPSKDHATFEGWYDSALLETEVTSIPNHSSGDVELFAKWTIDSYAVTLNTNGGTINSGDVTSYTYGVGATLPTDVTKAGHEFGGWFTNSECTGVPVTSISTTESGPKEYWAKWTACVYNIILHTNGGTINSGNVTEYTYGVGATLPTDVTRDYYTFGGWCVNSACTGIPVTGIGTKATGDQEYWAKWTPIEYNIGYFVGGGSNPSGNPATYNIEDTVNLLDATNGDFVFDGWYNNSSYTGSKINTITEGSHGDINLYTRWLLPSPYTYLQYEIVGTEIHILGVYDTSITAIEIPESLTLNGTSYTVTEIAQGAFSECRSVQSVTVPFVGGSKSTDGFFSYIFGGNTPEDSEHILPSSLSSIVLTADDDGVLPDYAFAYCYDVKSITIPNTITVIGESAFSMCDHARYINIPSGVTSIGEGAFANCEALVNVTIPAGVTEIAPYTFSDCVSLTSIVIPNNITSIGADAFDGCLCLVEVYDNSSSLTITKGDTTNGSVAEYAKEVITDNSPSRVTTVGGYVLYDDETDLWLINYFGDNLDVAVPEGVTRILPSCFYEYYSEITSISLPSTLKEIDDGSLNFGTNNIKHVYIEDGIESIPLGTFGGFDKLESIRMPNTLKTIGFSAFTGCKSLTSIYIPAGVTSIANEAFFNCFNLFEVINDSSLDITAGADTYGEIAKYAKQVITSAETSKIKTNNGFVTYEDGDDVWLLNYVGDEENIVIPSSVKHINQFALYDNYKIKSVVIPDGVTTIGYKAFANNNIRLITIPDSVTTIGNNAFANNYVLLSLSIPSTATVGTNITEDCPNLVEYITDGTPSKLSIDSNGFVTYSEVGDVYLASYIGNEKDIVIPNNVTKIKSSAFYFTEVRSIVIPDSVTSFEDNAFEYALELRYINIPDSVTNIGSGAFDYCFGLSSIYIPNTVTTIGANAFEACECLLIKCDPASKPAGWDVDWNPNNRPVTWGV